MTQSVEWRVIETLVELAGTFGAQCPHGFSLEIRLTHQDIADFVGASRQVVSSILSDLRKRLKGRHGMAVLDAGEIATQQTSPPLNITLRKASLPAITPDHFTNIYFWLLFRHRVHTLYTRRV